jgi:hypothetical protein
MTAREKALVTGLGTVALAVAVLGVATLWFDEAARLDAEYQGYRLAAARVLSQALAGPVDNGKARSVAAWESLLWPVDKAPGVVAFSGQIRTAAQSARLPVSSLRVVEEGKGGAWIQFQAQGTIGTWFAFLRELSGDPRVLYRSVLVKKAEGELYSYTGEVGYASLP